MRDIVAAGDLAHRLAVAVSPADRFALLVFDQFRFVAELDAARLRALAALAGPRTERQAGAESGIHGVAMEPRDSTLSHSGPHRYIVRSGCEAAIRGGFSARPTALVRRSTQTPSLLPLLVQASYRRFFHCKRHRAV